MRNAEALDRERDLLLQSEQMSERRRIMEDDMERMRKEVQEKGRQMEVEKAELVRRAKNAEDRCEELALRVSDLEHGGGQASAIESAVEDAKVGRVQREEEFEREKSALQRQIANLQQSLMDTSQTFAMLQMRNKENLVLSTLRRIGHRQLKRILQTWSILASSAEHKLEGVAADSEFPADVAVAVGDSKMGVQRDGEANVDAGQLRMMEDWVKDLTETVNALKRENASLLSQQQSGASKGGASDTSEAREEVRDYRTIFDSWRYLTSTSRSERRGLLLECMSKWRNCFKDLAATRELELQEEVSNLQSQLKAVQATVLNEQETSEKLVFLLTDKEAALEKLRCDLSQAQEELSARTTVETESQGRRERLAAAEAKVALLEDHIEQIGRKEASTRRQLEESDKDVDRQKCRVEELQAQLQQARVREKIWVLETTGNLSESGSGRRSSAGGEGHLRGVRLLCLEKAYIFTQYLIRCRSKRLMLRIMYCWGSFAAARRLEAENVSTVQPKALTVEESTWTGPLEDVQVVAPLQQPIQDLEQDGAAREREELATSLAISRERVQALEAKVEELMAVEEAYRKARQHHGSPPQIASSWQKEMQSPLVGADSTMATLSVDYSNDCSGDVDFDDTVAGANASPMCLQRSNVSESQQAKYNSPSLINETCCDLLATSTRPRLDASKTPEARVDDVQGDPPGILAGAEIPEMSPLLYATSDWHMSSPVSIEAQAVSVPTAQPEAAESGSETLLGDHIQPDWPKQLREDPGWTGHVAPGADDREVLTKSLMRSLPNVNRGKEDDIAVARSPADGVMQGSDCTPSAAHRGHRASSDPLAAFDHELAEGHDTLSQKALSSARKGVDNYPAQKDLEYQHPAMKTPTKIHSDASQHCLTPRSMLLHELRAFSNSLSAGIFPGTTPPQQQAPHDLLGETSDSREGSPKQEDHDEKNASGAGSRETVGTPKKMSARDSNHTDDSAPTGEPAIPTALARITAMPNPFTGSPGCFGQRTKSRNASGVDKGQQLVEKLASAQARQIANRTAKLSDLMQESLSIFASPQKAGQADGVPASDAMRPGDGLVVQSCLLHGDASASAASCMLSTPASEAARRPGLVLTVQCCLCFPGYSRGMHFANLNLHCDTGPYGFSFLQFGRLATCGRSLLRAHDHVCRPLAWLLRRHPLRRRWNTMMDRLEDQLVRCRG